MIFVVPESLSKHSKNDFRRTGQARTTRETEKQKGKNEQDRTKEGCGEIRSTLCGGGGVYRTLKGGTTTPKGRIAVKAKAKGQVPHPHTPSRKARWRITLFRVFLDSGGYGQPKAYQYFYLSCRA